MRKKTFLQNPVANMKRHCTDHELGINQIDIFINFKYVSPCTFLYVFNTLSLFEKKLEGGGEDKDKVIPLQALVDPEGSSRFRHQDL
jgi:hypothetical protein